MELIAWLHTMTVCIALASYAVSSAGFANSLWIVHVLDIMCPLCFMSFRLRGQPMADFCQMYTLALSVVKVYAVVIESVVVARHINTLCCGEAFIHIVVLLVAGVVSILFSLLEFSIAHTMAPKRHAH